MIDPALLEAAARRAEQLGVGGDEVLRCHGIVPPDLITRTIAEHLGLSVDPLGGRREPVSLAAACAGVLARGKRGWSRSITVAPRGLGVRKLAEALANDPRLADHLRLASPERIAEHVRAVSANELADEAVLGLARRRPDFSAIGRGCRETTWFTCLFAVSLLAAAFFAPDRLRLAIECFLAFFFITWTLLRFSSCLFAKQAARELDIPDERLPVYTIIVPLYREAPVVASLIAALRALDYPREKLDIKLMLEEDDVETRAAALRLSPTAPFEIIAPPKSGPRTKPKALAAALPFARGSFLTIYDAEDEPEPGQLRTALAAFAQGGADLACVQARLCVDNVADGWLSRQFAAEYAGQFDVFLPALAKMKLPIPLGGTSNHFRTDVLRKVGGWDPFNVTEDADLGMRLARFGYRIGVIDSTTWEEAPVGHAQWLRQRTRWFKGWMQTWIVHMRHPRRLRRDLGWRGFVAFQLLVGGTALSALVHPFFMAHVIHDIISGHFSAPSESLEQAFRKGLALATLSTGYFGSIALGIVGLKRRGILRHGWVLATIPIYWIFLSAACWRALHQLVRAPYRWEKTEHGLARSSLRRARDRKFGPA